jgi:hypothetical protein
MVRPRAPQPPYLPTRAQQVPQSRDASWIISLPYTQNGVFLGNIDAAGNRDWLWAAKIDLMVRCVPINHPGRPCAPRGAMEVEWLWMPGYWELEPFRAQAIRLINLLRSRLSAHRNILFWCTDGTRYSAAALACFLLCGPANPEHIMDLIRTRRPQVEPGAMPF